MSEAAAWETVDVTIHGACWKWFGHVARARVPALPKLALWGWPLLLSLGHVSVYRESGSRRCWLRLLSESISSRDWFRVAVSRGGQGQAACHVFFQRSAFGSSGFASAKFAVPGLSPNQMIPGSLCVWFIGV